MALIRFKILTLFLSLLIAGGCVMSDADGDEAGSGSTGMDLLDSSGVKVSSGSFSMVRDNLNNLIWEVKTDDGSIHDKDNKYTWYNSNPSENGGDAGELNGGANSETFINSLNSSSFGGYSDWRIPTKAELITIVDSSESAPAVDGDYFPETQSYSYWSSDNYEGDAAGAYFINFSSGSSGVNPKAREYHLRAVRP